MLGRLKMSIEEAEEAYCDLLGNLFRGSNVTQKIRNTLNDEYEQDDTSYDLLQKIRNLTKERAEFNTTLISGLRNKLRYPEELLKDPALDTSLSPCRV